MKSKVKAVEAYKTNSNAVVWRKLQVSTIPSCELTDHQRTNKRGSRSNVDQITLNCGQSVNKYRGGGGK